MEDTAAVEIMHLTRKFGQLYALENISFRVERGSVFGFIGPNGAGKTTTLRILGTLLEPSRGEAKVEGYSVDMHPEDVRRVIGFMPDNYGIYEGVTVWEFLEFFAGSHRMRGAAARRAIEDVMELTDLTSLSDRLAGTLSKGMRQRLCIARTLLHDPKVLLLDEPAAGLDPRARIEFRELVRELSRMGKTIVISSHILTELSDVCNSVGIIEKGRMVASGPIEEVMTLASGGMLLFVEVLDRAQEAADTLKDIEGIVDVRLEGKRIEAQFDGDLQRVPEIMKQLLGTGVPVVAFSRRELDLEELFMRLTKGEVM